MISLTRIAAILLFLVVAQACATSEECWRHGSSIRLETQHSPAVCIGLPAGSNGPHTEADTRDYRWETPAGPLRVKFWLSPSDLHAKKIAVVKINGDSVSLYKWRDYSSRDQLIAHWSPGKSIDRPVEVVVPVDWNHCDSVSDARSIIDSVRFINNPKRITAEFPILETSGWTVTLVNELGEKRQVVVGDVVTWDNGVVSEIDNHGLTVRTYDWEKGTWFETRIESMPQERR